MTVLSNKPTKFGIKKSSKNSLSLFQTDLAIDNKLTTTISFPMQSHKSIMPQS